MMTREHIYAVVVKHLVDAVEDLDPARIDPTLSMKDLGADSLDIVEVVSRTMRELKIKVPRSELSKLTNINGLVDMLYEVSQKRQVSV
jgi:acyl carrier protein